MPEVAAYRQALVRQARGQVANALRGKVPAAAIVGMIVRVGSPALVLWEVVAETGAGLIVLGGKQHSTLSR